MSKTSEHDKGTDSPLTRRHFIKSGVIGMTSAGVFRSPWLKSLNQKQNIWWNRCIHTRNDRQNGKRRPGCPRGHVRSSYETGLSNRLSCAMSARMSAWSTNTRYPPFEHVFWRIWRWRRFQCWIFIDSDTKQKRPSLQFMPCEELRKRMYVWDTGPTTTDHLPSQSDRLTGIQLFDLQCANGIRIGGPECLEAHGDESYRQRQDTREYK